MEDNELKIKLPFKVWERFLLKNYLNEMLQEGYLLERIVRLAEEKETHTAYEAYFSKKEKAELVHTKEYSVVYFESEDKWNEDEIIDEWIKNKELEGNEYRAEWEQYYIFITDKKKVEHHQDLKPQSNKIEEKYLKGRWVKQNLRYIVLGIIYILFEIERIKSEGIKWCFEYDMNWILGAVGIFYTLNGVYNFFQMERYKRYRYLSGNTFEKVNKKRRIEKIVGRIYISAIVIGLGIAIIESVSLVCKIVGMVSTILILMEIWEIVHYTKEIIHGISVISWLIAIIVMTIWGNKGSISYYGEEIMKIKQEYQTWPVIMLKDTINSKTQIEEMGRAIEGYRNRTLLGNYYQYSEEEISTDKESQSRHSKHKVQTEVYQCYLQTIEEKLWEEMKRDEGNDLVELTDKQLKMYGIDEGWINENETHLCIKKNRCIIMIKASKKELREILVDGRIEECINSL